MTPASLTAELATEIAFHEQSAEFHAMQAKRHRDRIAELEQKSADLGNGQLTAKQIERYPVVSGVRGTMRRDDADRLLDDDETRVASTIRWNAERNILELVESARESNSKAWDLTESQWNKITAQSRATYIPQRDGEYEATEPAEAAQ